ncbi:hypothetical protein LCGC14_0147550 [marine sediment metagenome]|uniref:Uncharacterized protein n=1 Tax=marine sediment metagenome TaxID=412755 RepID=A0A0F9Y1V3_9ZZZZ
MWYPRSILIQEIFCDLLEVGVVRDDGDVDEDEFPENYESERITNLKKSTLLRAVRDFLQFTIMTYEGIKETSRQHQSDLKWGYQAYTWIFSKNNIADNPLDYDFTFEGMCESVDYNPQALKEQLLKLTKENCITLKTYLSAERGFKLPNLLTSIPNDDFQLFFPQNELQVYEVSS